MVQASTIATFTTVGLATSLISYAIYFDYKRRNDPVFRKEIERRHKKTQKNKAADGAKIKVPVSSTNITKEDMKKEIEQINKEISAVQRTGQFENYFMTKITLAEQLAATGNALQAAGNFVRAIKVYPARQELLQIYEQTLPREIYELTMQLLSLEILEAEAEAASLAASSSKSKSPKTSPKSKTASTSSKSPNPSAPLISEGQIDDDLLKEIEGAVKNIMDEASKIPGTAAEEIKIETSIETVKVVDGAKVEEIGEKISEDLKDVEVVDSRNEGDVEKIIEGEAAVEEEQKEEEGEKEEDRPTSPFSQASSGEVVNDEEMEQSSSSFVQVEQEN